VDETWGRPLGTVAFGPETLHDLRSVTKSLVGLLYGMALADGKVPPPDAVLVDQFPEYPDLAADPARRRLTVAHVLSMTLGLEWNENLPYTSAANSEIAMELAPDRYRFVLERPIVGSPGQRWGYNGGATALLGRLIARGVAAGLPDYARAALFAPLGITAFDWIKGQDGTPSAASGLRLAPRDLARIGQLVIQRGRWDGRQVVPASWIDASFRPVVRIDEHVRLWPALVSRRGAGRGRVGVAPGVLDRRLRQWWAAALRRAGPRARGGDHRGQLRPAGAGPDAAQAVARHRVTEPDGRLSSYQARAGPGLAIPSGRSRPAGPLARCSPRAPRAPAAAGGCSASTARAGRAGAPRRSGRRPRTPCGRDR
jgi:CubicO group peptidase (beta-lactamase class C family)